MVEELLDVAEQGASHGFLGRPDAHGATQQEEVPQTARLGSELLTELGLAREGLGGVGRRLGIERALGSAMSDLRRNAGSA